MKKSLTSIFLIFILIFPSAPIIPVSAEVAATKVPLKSGIVKSLQINEKGIKEDRTVPKASIIKEQTINKLSDGKLKFNGNGERFFLSGKLSNKEIPSEKSATKFLVDNKSLFGLENIENELRFKSSNKDSIGHMFVKYSQIINGIPVFGGNITVHYDEDGVIQSINGNIEKNKIVNNSNNDLISEDEAMEIAKKQFTFNSLRIPPKAEKFILNKDNQNFEVYKVNISFSDPTFTNYDVFVDIHTGKVIQKENNIRYDGPIIGSGIDVLGSTKSLRLYQSGSSYQMKDVAETATSNISTYDLQNSTYFSNGHLVSNSSNYFSGEGNKASVSAHYNASKVINFYKNLFNRNSLDNNGTTINSFTHYSSYYNNAFWDGYEMVYGDGDGSEFTYLSGDLDVVGHEMTHGVISNTANLTYHNQPGALNESIADIFGVLNETYDKYNVANGGNWIFNSTDWVIGDDVYTPDVSGDALRSLSDPTLYDQPDNMSGFQNLPDTSSYDNGGVHTNSGIPNKAAYLVAKNIGMEKTARIYYRALVNYMSAYTDFASARSGLIQAATDLYGANSTEVQKVKNSFDSVGILDLEADPYEPNDTMSTAYPIVEGSTYQSFIYTSGDDDYYSIAPSATGTLMVNLSNVPYDYDLYVYDYYGTLIGFSYNGGTNSETVNLSVTRGSPYYINIKSYSGYSNTQKYMLSTSLSASAITVKFDSQGGTSVPSISVSYNSLISVPVTPTKMGYSFGGWYKDAACTNAWNFASDRVTNNTTLYAKWNLNSYRVSFDSQGGTGVPYIYANYSSLIAAPAVSTKIGYSFGGWYKDAACTNAWNFASDRVTNNTTLHAKWNINSYSVSFDSQGGTRVPIIYAKYNSLIAASAVPTKKGYSFSGWYKDKACTKTWNFAVDKVMNNATLYAKWITNPTVPTAVKAVSLSYNNVLVSWGTVSGATGYEIYRATSSTGRYTLLTTIKATNYNNAGLTTNITYYYKVRAYKLVGSTKVYSSFSSVVSAKPIPSTPTNLKAIRYSSTSIKLTWSGVGGASSFDIYRSNSSTGTYSLVKTTNSLSYINTGLVKSRTYYYKIRAFRLVGRTKVYSGWTKVAYAKTY